MVYVAAEMQLVLNVKFIYLLLLFYIFSPFPHAKLSLANALSVTVLLGSGAISLSKFNLPLQSLSSNII
jgi:hypothetical protein